MHPSSITGTMLSITTIALFSAKTQDELDLIYAVLAGNAGGQMHSRA